jgi:hypothetical protein
VSVVAVDLAAKFSAAVWLDEKRRVFHQCDSWQSTETYFIDTITQPWRHAVSPPAALIVEDLHPRVPWMTVVKDVCRLQGRIVERMSSYGHREAVVFVQPDQWRMHFEGLGRGTGPDAVSPVAEAFGYTAPLDLADRAVVKGSKATARKVATDYCAAYLIGRWALDYHDEHGNFDAPRTSRYTKL